MRLDVRSCLTTLLLGSVAASCMSPPGDEEPAMTAEELVSEDGQLPPADDIEYLLDADLDASATRDCIFIEWCNRPASIRPDVGTICRLRSGCGYSLANIIECNEDADAVCGAPVDPWYMCPIGVGPPCPL